MNRREVLRVELPIGATGGMLIGLAATFAVLGTPPLPPALLVALGIPSPLTGMTRSFVALASGDVMASLAWHPLGPLAFLACATAVAVAGLSLLRGRRLVALGRLLADRRLWAVGGAAVMLAWVRQIAVLG